MMADIIDFINRKKDKTLEGEYKSLLMKPKKENYAETPHIVNNIFSDGVLQQADLLFLPTDKFGYKYCLVVVDVFNRKCDAIPLKDKTSSAVAKGLKKIYQRETLLIPDTIQFDQGKEFHGEVAQFCKDEKVRAKYILTNRHRQNAMVEARNKAIGTTLLEYQNEKEHETGKQVKGWVDALPHLIKYLNEHLPKRKQLLGDDVITTKYSKDLIPLHTAVRAVLDYPTNAHDGSRIVGSGNFRGGDARWNKEPRTVEKIILNPHMPPMYQLDGKTEGIDNRVAYTKGQLQIIPANEKKIKRKGVV